MSKAVLNQQQEELQERLISLKNTVQEMGSKHDFGSAYDAKYSEMAEVAFQLATTLETPPVFTQSVLDGAGELTTSDLEFYHHIHVVEDLLNYLEDVNSNDSPEDVTLNAEFTLSIYSGRWKHEDIYHLTRNENGWKVSLNARNGQGDKGASPVLNSILENDMVVYPHNLNDYMEHIWNAAANGQSHESIQEQLDEISTWVSRVEQAKPFTL